MPAPIIFSTTGAALTSEEISFAQQVAASFSLDMNCGWIKIVRRIDPVSGVTVEYHSGKNIAYTTPGSMTDYVAMMMPNPIPYRGVSIGTIDIGAPTISVFSGAWTIKHGDGSIASMGAGSWDPVLVSSGGGGNYSEGPSTNWPLFNYNPWPHSPVKWEVHSGTLGYSSANNSYYPYGSFGSLGYEELFTADVAAGIAGKKTFVVTSDNNILFELQWPYLEEPLSSYPNYFVPQYTVDAWRGGNKLLYWGPSFTCSIQGAHTTTINIPEDIGSAPSPVFDFNELDPYQTQYPGPAMVGYINFPYLNMYSLRGDGATYLAVHAAYDVETGSAYEVGSTSIGNDYNAAIDYLWAVNTAAYAAVNPDISELITSWFADAKLGAEQSDARRKLWFKKNSDELIAALKTGFAPGTTGVTRAELQLGHLPSAWEYQIKRDVNTKYNSYTPTNTVGRKTKREILYSEVSFSETTESDTSANLTQAGVKVTARVVALQYTITVDDVVETRELTLTGYLTQTVTRHNDANGNQLALSRQDVYDNWYNREATSLPSGVPTAITAPYLKDRTTSRIGVVLSGTVQNGYNATSTTGTPGDPLTYALYIPPYPAAYSTVTAIVPDFIETWHNDAKIAYDKTGAGASNGLNDSAMHGVKEVHITPLGAYLSESLGIFPDTTTAQDATQVELFGTAIYGFDWQTGALTFKSWKARMDVTGNEVASEIVDLPASMTWGDTLINCVVTYKGIHWPDVVTALKTRDKTLEADDTVLYTIIQAVKAG